MCRLAFAFRRPLHELATWPAADLAVLKAYADLRPPTEERIEHALAVLTSIYVNAHAKQGAPTAKPTEFLMHNAPWPEPERDFATENRKAIAAFRNVSMRMRRQ